MVDSNVTPIKPQANEPEDYSLDIAIHLSHAHAVADLVQTVHGSAPDGSESRVDGLCISTLHSAMDCIMRSVEAVKDLQSKAERRSQREARP